MNLIRLLFNQEFLFQAMQLTIPILFAAMAALVSNKAGIININIEGSMSMSALIGALASFYTGSFVLGIVAGMLTGILMGMVLAFCSHKLKTDSILSGVALNIFATGFVVFLMYAILKTKGDTTSAPSVPIPYLSVPYLQDIPYIGLLFRQSLLFYIAIIALIVIAIMFNRSKLGLRIKAVGYNKEAARALGISIERTQLTALIIAGALAGLGGVFLSMAYLTTFNSGMVAGRGFIGLAAEAMGAGHPLMTMLFSFLFGLVSTIAIYGQIELNIPYELLNTMPYLMTIIALVIFSIRANRRINKGSIVKKLNGKNLR